jgi:hypothetical protein
VGNNPINGSDPSGKIVRLYFNPQFASLGHVDVVVYDPKTRRVVVYTGAGAGAVNLLTTQPGHFPNLKAFRRPDNKPWDSYEGHAYIDQDIEGMTRDGSPLNWKGWQKQWDPGTTPADDPEAYAPYLGGGSGGELDRHSFKAIGVTTGKTFEDEVKELDKAFKQLRQVPWYNPRYGPNSNTYAHQLLKLVGGHY